MCEWNNRGRLESLSSTKLVLWKKTNFVSGYFNTFDWGPYIWDVVVREKVWYLPLRLALVCENNPETALVGAARKAQNI